MSDSDSEKSKEAKRRFEDFIKEGPGLTFNMPFVPKPFGMAAGKPGKEQDEEDSFELQFDYKPREVKKYLDRFVIGQTDAKKALSIAICDHYNYVKQAQEGKGLHHYLKQNILLLGPTGVGKTYLIRCLAEMIGVPFVKADATKFSETGYVGQDVDDLARQLVQLADGNVALAECGIIYLDEIDKLASSGGAQGGRDVSGRGVQTNLLKLMEETEVPLRASHDMQGQLEAAFEMMQGSRSKKPKTINTKTILFIASGSFPKLNEIVARRIRQGSIGFQSGEPLGDLDYEKFEGLSTKDLMEYGFEAEFAGRLPVRVVCHPLAASDLRNILLQSEGSILNQYKQAFLAYGIDATFTDEAIDQVAELAAKEETGARGLMSVLEEKLRDLKFEIPSTKLSEVEIDGAFVQDPAQGLKKLMEQAKSIEQEQFESILAEFAESFWKRFQIKIRFTPEAGRELNRMVAKSDKTFLEFCEERFRDFPYGLKLIARNRDAAEFVIDVDAVVNPDKALSDWVVSSYGHSPAKDREAEGEEKK